MGLEESPHCPFDVMEACRTGVGGDGGGAAEEMDQDGAGTADDGGGEPCWAEMTRNQKKKWKKQGGRGRPAPTI